MAVGRAVRSLDGSLDTAWKVLADHLGMATWLPVPGMSVTLERPGEPELGGVGAIRAITTPTGGSIREEVTVFEPRHRLAYRALSGIPLPDWTGEIELAELGDNAIARWTITSSTTIPGGNLILTAAAQGLLSAYAHAANRAAKQGD